MTTSAPRRDENGQSRFDERTKRAWRVYRESLRDLSGRDYDEAERRSWDRLQRKLQQVDEDRAAHLSSAPRRR